MRIKEGILPPAPHIRRDLKAFEYGGFEERYLGLPCEITGKDYRPRTIYITFIDPEDNVKIEYTMLKSEIEYI